MSDAVRAVVGDAAMGDRVRVLLEFQYAGAQDTAHLSFSFIDRYFNNGDGQHMTTPHPVRYYVWGAGGAGYYGVGNQWGMQDEVVMPDGGFEQAPVPEGTETAPAGGTPWKFSGGAALYRNFSVALAGYQPGKTIPQTPHIAMGFKFTVGDQPLFVASR